MCVEFKAGDKVRIRSWQDMEDEFGIREDGNIPCHKTFTEEMKFLCGKEFEITRISEAHGLVHGLECDYIISTDMIEPVGTSAKLKYDLEKMKAKIKEMEEKITEAEIEEAKPQKISGVIDMIGRAPRGSRYYYANNNYVSDYLEDGDATDDKMYDMANYFTTKESAERSLFERNLYFKLMRYSSQNGGADIDWTNTDESKYQIFYDYKENRLKTSVQHYYRRQGSVYFATEDAAKAAINEFKEELIRYFTTSK